MRAVGGATRSSVSKLGRHAYFANKAAIAQLL